MRQGRDSGLYWPCQLTIMDVRGAGAEGGAARTQGDQQ